MSLIERKTDFGTPRSKSQTMVTPDHRRPADLGARGHLDHARGGWKPARKIPKALRHRHGRRIRLPAGFWPGRDRRPAPAHRPSCTTTVMPGPRGSTPRPSGLKKLRKGVMELYISDHPLGLPDLCGQRAIANCRTWPARSACATWRLWL